MSRHRRILMVVALGALVMLYAETLTTVDAPWWNVVMGALLVVAMLYYVWAQRRSERRAKEDDTDTTRAGRHP
jgi:membrane protein implicated in regulation of membrane protease activity